MATSHSAGLALVRESLSVSSLGAFNALWHGHVNHFVLPSTGRALDVCGYGFAQELICRACTT
jgi:hypothetical protein